MNNSSWAQLSKTQPKWCPLSASTSHSQPSVSSPPFIQLVLPIDHPVNPPSSFHPVCTSVLAHIIYFLVHCSSLYLAPASSLPSPNISSTRLSSPLEILKWLFTATRNKTDPLSCCLPPAPSHPYYDPAMLNYLQCHECSVQHCSTQLSAMMEYGSRMWLLATWNVTRTTEELIFKLYLLLPNLNLNSPTQLVDTYWQHSSLDHKVWSSCMDITWKLVRNAESQASSWICWFRICISTRSPGDLYALHTVLLLHCLCMCCCPCLDCLSPPLLCSRTPIYPLRLNIYNHNIFLIWLSGGQRMKGVGGEEWEGERKCLW